MYEKSFSSISIKRGTFDGTFSLTNRCSISFDFMIIPRFSESPEMCGNGCAESTARGVSIGKISEQKREVKLSCSCCESESHCTW